MSMLNIETTTAKRLQVSILNLVGQIISTETVNVGDGKNTVKLNTNGLSSGIYMLSITENGKQIKNIKLVK
jgi:hypothetical protein